MRWTWIDRFVAFEPGKSAVAVKNLSHAEDHFADHFPGFPVMPAPLILEGLAQTGRIIKSIGPHPLRELMDGSFNIALALPGFCDILRP